MWNIDFRKEPHIEGSNPLGDAFVRVSYMGYLDQLPQWHFFWHLHTDETEIILVTSGRGILHVGKRDIPISRGDVCILSPNILHYCTGSPDEALSYYSLRLEVNVTNPMTVYLQTLECAVLPLGERFRYMEVVYEELTRQLSENGECAGPVFQAACHSLVMWIEQQARIRNLEPVRWRQLMVQDIFVYIFQHYAEPLTLQTLCHRFGISRSALNRIFHEICHISPISYIIYYRITLAVILLQDTDLPVSEIASRVGYQNPAHFARLFQQHIGYTPTEFRQMQREKQPAHGEVFP